MSGGKKLQTVSKLVAELARVWNFTLSSKVWRLRLRLMEGSERLPINLTNRRTARHAHFIPTVLLALVSCLGVLGSLAGCGNSPASQIGAFDDPSATADAALELLDENSAGILDQSELAGCLGLQSGAQRIDANGDQQLDRAELLARFQKLGSMSDIVGVQVIVAKSGQPLANAQVSLTPAPFLGEGRQSYQGVSNPRGSCLLQGESVQLPGLPTGYYTAEIVDKASGVPSQLGCEIADDASGSRLLLNLESD